jgi:hypothetical protein
MIVNVLGSSSEQNLGLPATGRATEHRLMCWKD